MSTKVLASVGGPDQIFRHSGVRRDPTWGPSVGVFLVWLTSLIAVGIYLLQGGMKKFDTPAHIVTSLGIVSGLVATNLMVVMLIAVARVPVIDRLIGYDVTVKAHRDLGPWVTGLLVAHMAYLLMGWAIASGEGLWATAVEMFKINDILLAFISMGLLALVGVSSFMAVRRKLGYEIWYLIHLASYVAIGLSIPHMFTSGKMFSQGPAQWYWAGLLLLTAYCLLTYRLILPLVTSLEQSFKVVDVVDEAPDVVSIIVQGKHLDRLAPEAGQFFRWRFLTPALWWRQHPFSLSAAPHGNFMRLTVRCMGRGSDAIMRVTPGTRILIEGPYGRFRVTSARTRHLVLIGAGVGMAPVRALLDEADHFETVTVIQRASTERQSLYEHDLEQTCIDKGFTYYHLVGPRGEGWLPASCDGYGLADFVPHVASADVYFCGPLAWSNSVEADAKACGVPAKQRHTERFDW